MRIKLCYLLLLTTITLLVSGAKRYDGYKVVGVVPVTMQQLKFLAELMFTEPELDFWEEPTMIGNNVVIMVAPQDYRLIVLEFDIQGLPITVLNHNVQNTIDAEKISHMKKPINFAYDYEIFNTYEDFMDETDALAADCPSDVTCTVTEIGQSYEGRQIKLLHIDTGAPRDFFMDGCIHAREWLACATLMKLVNHMIRNAPTDPEADRVMKTHNWHIVPVVNPDGYIFSHTDDRMWRKSRNPNEGSDCLGTDLNRNHDYNWNTGGTSTNPCSDTFHGSGAGSEPEIQALQNASLSVDNPLTGWLTIHTYAKMLLWPYGDGSQPPNNQSIARVADATCGAIMATHDTLWECGNAHDTLYPTSGTTRDWATGAAGALYSYTAELRGDGFVVDTDEIQPSFEEMWNGLTAFVDEVIAIEEESKAVS